MLNQFFRMGQELMKLLVLTAFALAVLVALAEPFSVPGMAQVVPLSPAPVPIRPLQPFLAEVGEVKAVSFTAWSEYGFLSEDAYASLVNARTIGCNWIAICVWEFQENITSTEIEPDYTSYSARPESVAQAIQWCHQLGMKVMLKPMVDLGNDLDHWRGDIVPSAPWFESYEDFINSWAALAQANDVELFCVGCELKNTVAWSTSWRSVIQAVQNRYGGPVTYAANHDNAQNVSWWDAVDYIGIDAYYPLTSTNDPALAELQAAWGSKANAIEAWLTSTWPAREVIFTEVGYQSLDGTNKTPWWRDPVTNDLDPAEQADCYDALLSVCEQRSWWLGAFWWNWETDPDAGGLADPDFTPHNKPAELVLRAYYGPPLRITDVYWDQVSTSVVIVFASAEGTGYVLEAADADAYADGLTWNPVPGATLTGTVPQDEFSDDLTTHPLIAAFRFYRVRRSDGTNTSRQTAAVFELELSASVAVSLNFISTPLLPDPDHDSAREIFGEGAARQIPRPNFQVSDLDESTGVISRMRYEFASPTVFTLMAGAEFDIVPGASYELLMGGGFTPTYKVRLTGYVPETAVETPLTKVGIISQRWIAYSMPRPTTLDDLGLVAAVTGFGQWQPTNRVRIMPHGLSFWTNYQYDKINGYWYELGAPGTPVNPTIACGTGIEFFRDGWPNATDKLVCPVWYLSPPNNW